MQKEHWPKAHVISYSEWWFNPESDVYSYDQNNVYLGLNPQTAEKHWLRNGIISLELLTADIIVSPTEWQKQQLPNLLKRKCKVIFDGIDVEKFKPLTSTFDTLKGEKILSYGTRGMEPMRGFAQFIESIPSITRNVPEVTVEIAGNDEVNYGGGGAKREILEKLGN